MKMTKHLASSFLVSAAVLALGSCTAGQITTFTETLEAPTIDSVVELTAVADITVTGTKAAGSAAWLHLDGEADAIQIAPEGESTTWTTPLILSEGLNTFVVFATKADVFSEVVGPVSAELDTTPPTVPVIDPPATPTTSATVSLTGTRAFDGNLCLRVNQEPTCTEVDPIPPTDTTDPSFTLAGLSLSPGFNTLCLSSTDALGNTSAETCVDIELVAGPIVTIASPAANAIVTGSSIPVVVLVQTGPNAAEVVTGVDICLDLSVDCIAATEDINTGNWEATLALTNLTDNSVYSIDATATNVVLGTGQGTVSVTYDAGGVEVVSDTDTPATSRETSMLVDANGNVHVVWADECFQLPACLSTSTETKAPVPAAGRAAPIPWDVFYRVYDSTARTWGAIQLISDDHPAADDNAEDTSRNPAIAMDINGHIHVVWADSGERPNADADSSEKIVSRLIDGTTGIPSPVIAVVARTPDADTRPRLAAAADGSMSLVWDRRPQTDNNDHDIYFSRWTPDSGDPTTGIWSTPVLVSDETPASNDHRSVLPDVATDSQSITWVVWQEEPVCAFIGGQTGCQGKTGCTWSGLICEPTTGFDGDIYLRSIDSSDTLGPLTKVTDNGLDGQSAFPRIVNRSDTLHIVWKDDANIQYGTDTSVTPAVPLWSGTDFDIWHRTFSASTGLATSQYLLMTQESDGNAGEPTLAFTADGSIAVAWSERIGSTLTSEIHYTVNRASEAGPQTTVSTALELSLAPAIAVTPNGDFVVAWQDDDMIGGVDDGDTDVFWLLLPSSTNWDQVP